MAADFDHFGSFSQHWQPRYELFFDMNGAFSDTPALQRRFRVQLWPARPPSQVPAPSLLLSLICKRTGSFGTRCSIFALFSAWEDVARWRSPGLCRHTAKGTRAWEVLQWLAATKEVSAESHGVSLGESWSKSGLGTGAPYAVFHV